MSSTTTHRKTSTSTLTDTEWLQSLAVAMPEPESWQTALRTGNTGLVAKQLRKRLSVLSGHKLLATLRWCCDAQGDSLTIDTIDELQHVLQGKGKRRCELATGMLEAWLDRQSSVAVPSLLDQLLASIVLVELIGDLADSTLVRLWRFVEERTGHSAPSPSAIHAAVRELLHLEQQLLRMLAAATQPPRKSDLGPVAQGLREFLQKFTDKTGAPAAELHASLPALTACILRLQTVSQALELPLGDKSDQRRIPRLARQALLLCPIDASWLPSRTPHEALDWMKRLVKMFDLRSDEAIAGLLRLWGDASLAKAVPKASSISRGRRTGLKKKQLISHQSDDAQYAYLHGDWRESRDHALVKFHGPSLQLEASVLETPLFQGTWSARVTIGEQTFTHGEWVCCCWFSGVGGDYCEFKWEPIEGVTIYRQMLWARNDRFLVIADEVRASGHRPIRFESELPLAASWSAQEDGRTREWQLRQGDALVRVFPIFQHQQKVQKTDGRLECSSQQVRTVLTSEQDAGYAAIVMDWDLQRRNSPVQWSPLTVTEDRQRLARSIASGARWRVGDDLWLVYHQSAKGDSPRAILGLHTHHETVIARVKDGAYPPLVEVETD